MTTWLLTIILTTASGDTRTEHATYHTKAACEAAKVEWTTHSLSNKAITKVAATCAEQSPPKATTKPK